MRHRKRTAKIGMKSQHRRATLANLVCSLIEYSRITTTVAKAKVARRYADKMVTLAKKGTLHHRREALAFLRHKPAVAKLFAEMGNNTVTATAVIPGLSASDSDWETPRMWPFSNGRAP